ncbi:MAG: DUF2264 domain-containing protein [Clostridia bacterium]|nr:DUF2264 domain-containing protein [Clostridia bacterium]
MNYNKEYFTGLLRDLILPLKKYYSSEFANLYIGHTGAAYEDCTIPMEGFARVLWGIAPLWAGGGDIDGFSDIYTKGLSAGTNPNSDEYWGEFRNFDQKFVEMAAIAYGLLLAPDKLWEPLDDTAKDNLATFLIGINDYKVSDNNWRMFPVLVNLALKSLSLPYSQDLINFGLERLDSFYLGNGWYKDGATEQRDYYVAFALHFYSLIYAKVCAKEDPARCNLFKKRAAKFAKDYIYWFDEKGRGLVYGRSLTYRFAQAAFWSACIYTDVPVFNLGIIKGILVRHFEEWFSHPIIDNSGVLTIGYRYPNLHMSESYNSPDSPYWSLKTFIVLALPDNHPFWQAEAEPMPKLDNLKVLNEAQMIIQRDSDKVTALTPGRLHYINHVHVSEKYCKFAYSSEFGFSIPRSNKFFNQAAPDSTLSFEIDGYIFTRRLSLKIRVEEDKLFSLWSPFKGIEVETTLIPIEEGHIRRHKITSDYDCNARDAGFAVSCAQGTDCAFSSENNIAIVKNNFSFCSVESTAGGTPDIISFHPNTSLVYQKTFTPLVSYEIKKGITEIETIVKY